MSHKSYVIKVALEDDVRRLNFETQPGTVGGLSFTELETQVRELFEVPASRKLKFQYVDCDSDTVTMANERDLKDACVGQNLNPLRIRVVPIVEKKQQTNRTMDNYEDEGEDKEAAPDQEEEESGIYNSLKKAAAGDADENVHDARCNVCGMDPIIGNRYSSTIIQDYDLCSACYGKTGLYNGVFELVDPAAPVDTTQYNSTTKEGYDYSSGYDKTGGYNGEHELVNRAAPVDPVAQAEANMRAMALQRMQHQNHMAALQTQQYWTQAMAQSMVDNARAISSLVD
ncbi:hypothetical protein R1sor_008674 [Riccia sorocarpa]|uniref:ZZ-type domain-containing protein n=1 Tax=Riccia sorocarpa TaxID=122646 RepID=A0ABD3HUB1_9MARC